MFLYWLLFTLTAIPAMVTRGRWQDRRARFGAAVLALIITLFVGMRYEVGGDWKSYLEIFDEVRYLPLSDILTYRADPGFTALNKLVLWAGFQYWAVNLVCAMIFTWSLFRFSFRLPNPWLAIAVATPYFVIVVAMGYTRQAVAIGLVMVALTAVAEHSFGRFIFWTILAATFHKSAVIVIPIVGMSYARSRLFVWAFAAIFTALGYYFFVSYRFDTLVANYSDYESQGAAIRVLMNALPAGIYLLTMKRYPLPRSEKVTWRNFSIISIASLVLIFEIQATTALDRLALYLIPLQLFVFGWLPSTFTQDGRPDRKLAIAVVVYSAAVLFVWLNYADNAQYWIPYQVYPLLGKS